MPNWVLNNVKFGTDKVLKECMTTKNGHADFDFEKILPMQDVLKDEDESGDTYTAEAKARPLSIPVSIDRFGCLETDKP